MDETDLAIAYRPVDFDFERWLQLSARPISGSEIDLGLLGPPHQEEGWVADGLKEISDAMVRDLGFSVNDLLSTLTVLVRHCVDSGFEFLTFSERPLGPGISPAAVEYLTFSEEDISLSELRPSDTRHQARRVWTSPLLRSSGRYYVFRDLAFEANLRWIRYLTQGDWPTPRNKLEKEAPALFRALADRSQKFGYEFEAYVGRKISATGLPYSSLKKGALVGNVRLSREIDAVVVDLAQHSIHVLEFKNLSSDHNAMSLQSELKKFLSVFAPKLRQSVREAEDNTLAFVRRVLEINGVEPVDLGAADEWKVRSAFVFSSHSPIECLTAPQFFEAVGADHVSALFSQGRSS